MTLRHCVREAQNGNHEATLFLLGQFSPLIKKQVKKYNGYYQSVEEAISTAHAAACRCIFEFDLTKPGNVERQMMACIHNTFEREGYHKEKNEILDTRFNTYLPGGDLLKMIPRASDGQLLFLLNNVSKMKTDTELGSRIIEVHNGSSLFTGDAGSGESNARRYLIESDLVEAIIALPDNMFYNTGIGTYIWVLSNKKEARRKGKIQLIDATQMKSPLRKNMGNKNCEFTPDIRKEIVRIFLDMEESDVSKVFDNSEFGYWNVTVDRPLRLRVFPEREIPEKDEKGKVLFKKHTELLDVRQAVQEAAKTAPFDDWDAFAKATKLKKTQLKKIRPYITETDPEAKEVAGEADPELRDTENIPFQYEGGIHTFMEKEVLPYAPDAYVDEDKTKIGYEISFTKYFYKPVKLRDMKDILASLAELEKESEGVMDDIVRGLE